MLLCYFDTYQTQDYYLIQGHNLNNLVYSNCYKLTTNKQIL